MSFCESCFKKDRKIDELEEEIVRLKSRIRYEQLKNKEGYFGSSTPSSQKPVKANSQNSSERKNGGAVKGHEGHGRRTISEAEADRIEYLSTDDECPDCKNKLVSKGTIRRSVIESNPIKIEKVSYEYEKKYCPKCNKIVSNKPRILPKSLYGNQLVTQSIVMHYAHGIPAGTVEEILGNIFPENGLYDIYHRVAKLWESAIPKIILEYRQEPVKHGDETGWRTDGESGYAWIFCSKNISLFQFKETRSSRVPLEIFGSEKVPGVLIVDRYQGYNKVPCKIQYCYAHLLRQVEDLGKEFAAVSEIQCFVGSLAPLLSSAMHLRTTNISDKIYYHKAEKIKTEIVGIINTPAAHSGIIKIQMIFKTNDDRLYHWVEDRNVPAENNTAERELRPTVIARKVSFGSQSKKGALTRSTLMTILHTAQKRLKDKTLEEWFKESLDYLSQNQEADPYSLLPHSNSS